MQLPYQTYSQGPPQIPLANYNDMLAYFFTPQPTAETTVLYQSQPDTVSVQPEYTARPEPTPGTLLITHQTEDEYISNLYKSMADTSEWPLDPEGKPQRWDRHLHKHMDCITETDYYIAEQQKIAWEEEKQVTKDIAVALDKRNDRPMKFDAEWHCKRLLYIASKTPFKYLWAKDLGVTYQTLKSWVDIYPDTFGRVWDEVKYYPGILWEEYIEDFRKQKKLSPNVALKLLEKNKDYHEDYGDQIKKEVRNQLTEMTHDIQRAAYNQAYSEKHPVVNPEDLQNSLKR